MYKGDKLQPQILSNSVMQCGSYILALLLIIDAVKLLRKKRNHFLHVDFFWLIVRERNAHLIYVPKEGLGLGLRSAWRVDGGNVNAAFRRAASRRLNRTPV